MDAENRGQAGFRLSIRSMTLAVAVLAILAGSMAWGIRQSRLTQEALERARAAEQAATRRQADSAEPSRPLQGKAKILHDEAIQRAARRDPKKEAERLRQLHEEIDTLMHIQEGIEQDLRNLRRQMPGPADAAADANPRPDAGSP